MSQEDWYLSNGRDFRSGIDEKEKHGASGSVFLKSVVPRPKELGFISRTVQSDSYTGKRLRFSAWVKTRLPEGASVQMWLKAHGDWESSHMASCFDNMFKRRIKGDSEWQQYEVEIDVPPATEKIIYGILLNGTGKLWLDGVSLKVVEPALK